MTRIKDMIGPMTKSGRLTSMDYTQFHQQNYWRKRGESGIKPIRTLILIAIMSLDNNNSKARIMPGVKDLE